MYNNTDSNSDYYNGYAVYVIGNFMNGVFDDKSASEVISNGEQNGQYTVYTTDKLAGIINRDISEVTELICLTINRNGYNIKIPDANSAEEAFSTEPDMKDLIIIPENLLRFRRILHNLALSMIY